MIGQIKKKAIKAQKIAAAKLQSGQPDLPKRSRASDPEAARGSVCSGLSAQQDHAPISATNRAVKGGPAQSSMASNEFSENLREFHRLSLRKGLGLAPRGSIASEQTQQPSRDALLLAPPPPSGSSRECYLAWLLRIGYTLKAAGVIALPILRSALTSSALFLSPHSFPPGARGVVLVSPRRLGVSAVRIPDMPSPSSLHQLLHPRNSGGVAP